MCVSLKCKSPKNKFKIYKTEHTICQSHRVQGNILTFCMFEMWILNLIILDNMYDSLIQWCELPLSNGYFLLNSDSKYDPFIQWRQHYHFQTEYLYWTQDKKHTHTFIINKKKKNLWLLPESYIHIKYIKPYIFVIRTIQWNLSTKIQIILGLKCPKNVFTEKLGEIYFYYRLDNTITTFTCKYMYYNKKQY
jgi:hypothetical protein